MGAPDISEAGVCSIGAPRGRLPGDDFFCIRYQVWYSSRDCAIRTKFRTAPGCLRCEQGRFNLKRHEAALRQVRLRPPVRE